jgi:hypothetical protein
LAVSLHRRLDCVGDLGDAGDSKDVEVAAGQVTERVDEGHPYAGGAGAKNVGREVVPQVKRPLGEHPDSIEGDAKIRGSGFSTPTTALSITASSTPLTPSSSKSLSSMPSELLTTATWPPRPRRRSSAATRPSGTSE